MHIIILRIYIVYYISGDSNGAFQQQRLCSVSKDESKQLCTFDFKTWARQNVNDTILALSCED